MKKTVTVFIVLFSSAAFSVGKEDKPKKEKISWKDVVIAEKEPSGCESLGKVDQSKSSFFAFTYKQVKGRVEKGLKKKAAKLGGNTLFITEKVVIDGGAAFEAKAYYCTEAQAG